jgi:hypothetical protein
VIPRTLRDSLTLLALLLEQEAELEPLEIMTDTPAYSDAIFGLFWLLATSSARASPTSAAPSSGASTGKPTADRPTRSRAERSTPR